MIFESLFIQNLLSYVQIVSIYTPVKKIMRKISLHTRRLIKSQSKVCPSKLNIPKLLQEIVEPIREL